jgi:hypothetical protein
MHSVLFDHHLERVDGTSQCRVIQECFDAHAQRCEAQFSSHQMTFMRIMCISSALHGASSTISSQRTRGLMQLLFLRLWPMTPQEKEVALSVNKAMLCHRLQARLSIFARVAVHTSIMELVAWLGLIVYAHTILSNSAVTGVATGLYDEMLQKSSKPWNVSRGQDPRFIADMIHLMSDNLLACLAFCSLFPVPVSASLILLLPVTLWIQVCICICLLCLKCSDLIVASLRRPPSASLLFANRNVVTDFALHFAQRHSKPSAKLCWHGHIAALYSSGMLHIVASQLVSVAQLPQRLRDWRSSKIELPSARSR